MYEFVRGPMMWISVIIFIVGLSIQANRLFRITGKKEIKPYSSKIKKTTLIQKIKSFINFKWLIRFFSNIPFAIKDSIIAKEPFTIIVTSIFHFCLIFTPLFLMGHNILLFESWSFSLPSISERLADVLTVIALACGIMLLVRRIVVSRVRAVTTIYDYLLLLITLAPFMTGFLAYHQFINYRTIIIIHILAGELMLIALGVTKLGHMVFFFFVRYLVGSEYSIGKGRRRWIIENRKMGESHV